MHVSTRALGAGDGNPGRAAAQVVEYLETGTRGAVPATPGPEDRSDGTAGYYADSAEKAGVWLGRGVGSVRPTGTVEREAFRRVLLGRDPATGEQLVSAVGSAGRAELAHGGPRALPNQECLTVAEAAEVLGVRRQYVERLAERWEQQQARVAEEASPLPRSYLASTRDRNDRRLFATTEVERFAASRRKPAVTVGYDVTFSCPKSVSVLWAVLGPDEQAEIVAAVDAAVAAGVSYLENHAAFVRVKGQRLRSEGIVAASYLHATSRALEPQLHRHVVVANMGSAGGRVQALDGTGLHVHQRAAAALAGAELRRQLTDRLGVEWGPVRNGKADIIGVPGEAIREMSSRSRQIDSLVAELGSDSLTARQVAAYQTRAAKQATAPSELQGEWRHRLRGAGLGRRAARRCLGKSSAPGELQPTDTADLHRHLAVAVTEESACFDARDVIRAVADWAGNRLSAAEILTVAEGWLATEDVVPLGVADVRSRANDTIRRADGRRVSAATGERLYTTGEMLELEARVRGAVDRGAHTGAGAVEPTIVDDVLAQSPTLGADQAALVRAITTSGHRIQAAVGPAGTGKTFALDLAARVWTAAGFRPVGVAVGGTAAEVLGRATGIPSTTVASLLTRLDLAAPGDAVLDHRAVVIVDEASTLGNRDLDRLVRHVERAGATLRLVGDPSQHSAVPAGGLWRVLVESTPEDTPRLTTLRRQRGDLMAPVREALEEYRRGEVHLALQRLETDGRLVEADTAEELLDHLVADWYGDRQRRVDDPGRAPSSMVAEHHHERRELTRRARTLLAADGTLTGPAIQVDGVEWQAGDEVIARLQDRALRPAGGDRRSYVRNGTRGTVRAVLRPAGPTPALLVDFNGRGLIEVPWRYLTAEVRPGVHGGLTHSYALTSYAAQGETYDAARHLATDRSTRAGLYVGLSRGANDARLYVVRSAALDGDDGEGHGLPRPEAVDDASEALRRRLHADGMERLPTEVDPDAEVVMTLARSFSLTELLDQASDDELAGRAADVRATRVATLGRLNPPGLLQAVVGARPPEGPTRGRWDHAVGLAAIYLDRWPATERGHGLLGHRPLDPDAAAAFDRVTELLAALNVPPPAPAPPPPPTLAGP